MRIIIFGSIPLATKMLKHLLEHPLSEVVGVVCEKTHKTFDKHYFREPSVYTVAIEKKIPVYTIEELGSKFKKSSLELGFSGRFDKIIPLRIISIFRKGIINMHGGPLPMYRGVHGNIHAILNGEERFAGSLHYIDEGVDTGPVIDQDWFDIKPDDTGFDVFCKVQIAQWNTYLKNIDAILRDKDQAISQKDLVKQGARVSTYRSSDIINRKQINLTMSTKDIFRHIRAFDFPGHSPCFINLENKKIYLRTQCYY